MQLATIDWVIICAYFVGTLGIGLAFAKRAGRSMSDFFVSGRSLPWWIAGTSMVATTFAADTPLAVTSIVAKNGLAGNWFWWSLAIGGMITVFVFSRMWRRANVITEVELIELRYSGKPAAALRGIRAFYFALIVNPIIVGWVTKGMIDMLNYTVFYDPVTSSVESSVTQNWMIILGLFAVVGIYSSMSGMWGVAVTDVIQFALAMVGCIWLAILAVQHVGGISALESRITDQFGTEGASQVFAFIPDFSSESVWLPLSSFLILIGMNWWATWNPGAEPGGGGYVVQRMAACKDESHALKATLWYQIAHYCIRPWPWLIVAFVALALYPEIRNSANPGVGFPLVIQEVAPFGLRGLLLVTFFAAFMSTISTQMNWGASMLVKDIYQRFLNPKATNKQLAGAARWASVLVLVVGVASAYVMVEKNVSVDAAWKFLAALGAGGGLVYLLRWFWWRISAWSEIAGMAGSLFFFFYWANDDRLNAEERIMFVAIPTIFLWLLVTYLMPPEPHKKLIAFYRAVRPGGPGWKPIAAQARDVKPDRHFGISIMGALIASGIVYSLLFAIGRLIFLDYGNAALGFGLAAICSVIVFFIVRKVTEEDPSES